MIQKYISRWVAGLGFKLGLSYTYHEYYHNSRRYGVRLRVLAYLAWCMGYTQPALARGLGASPLGKVLKNFALLRLNLEVLMEL